MDNQSKGGNIVFKAGDATERGKGGDIFISGGIYKAGDAAQNIKSISKKNESWLWVIVKRVLFPLLVLILATLITYFVFGIGKSSDQLSSTRSPQKIGVNYGIAQLGNNNNATQTTTFYQGRSEMTLIDKDTALIITKLKSLPAEDFHINSALGSREAESFGSQLVMLLQKSGWSVVLDRGFMDVGINPEFKGIIISIPRGEVPTSAKFLKDWLLSNQFNVVLTQKYGHYNEIMVLP